jgi:hypothetical protein
MQKLHQLYSGTIKFEDGSRFVFDDTKSRFIAQKFKGQKIAIFYKFIAELEAIKRHIDITDNIRKHVTSEEYHKNKDRYISNGTGTVNVFNKNTGERYRLPIDIVNNNKEKYIVGTSGWATVFDIKLNKFINIPKGTLNRRVHKLAQDKKFICYNVDGSIKFEFWGGKKEFLEKYKCPESVWVAALKEETFISNRKRSAEFNGCKFVLVDWKP